MYRSLLMILGLMLLTAAIYSPITRCGFIDFDDPAYLVENPFTKTGINAASVHDAFSHFRFLTYTPLVSLSYCLDQTLFGLKPGPMHAEDVLLHLLSGILLWRALFAATGQYFKSYAVAGLFLCHPMHVESVAWIAERKDVLSTMLLMVTMLLYVHFTQSPPGGRRWVLYAAMLISFTLSLLAKSMAATFPAVLLLLDFWPLRRGLYRTWTKLWMEKIPLMVLSVVAVVVSNIALKSGMAPQPVPWLSFTNRIENALVCYTIYVAKALVPINLAVFYPHPVSRPLAGVVAASFLLAIVTAAFCRWRYSRPYLLVGWLWFMGTLLPVIQIVQLGGHAMADRYSYFSFVGLSIAIIWWIYDRRRSNVLLNASFVLVVCIYSCLAYRQVTYWKDTETLFTHALDVTEDNALPHDELGGVALSRHDLRGAFDEYQHALNDSPDANACHGLGNCYLGIDYSKSVYYYQMAVNLLPQSVNYRTDLAGALRLDGNLQEAKRQAQIAVDVDPDYAPARAELAKTLSELRVKP